MTDPSNDGNTPAFREETAGHMRADVGKAHASPARLQEGHVRVDLPLGHAAPMWSQGTDQRGHGVPVAHVQGTPIPPPMTPGIGRVARAPHPTPAPPPASTEK